MYQTNCTTNLEDPTIPLYAAVVADTGVVVPVAACVSSPGRIALIFEACSPTGGADLELMAPGMAPWTGRLVLPHSAQEEGPPILFIPGLNPFRKRPPPPTRAAVLAFQGSMQGLLVHSPDYATPIPYWEGTIAWFTPETRRLIYAAKHAKGDTHCGIQLSGAYPFAWYASFPGVDWTPDLPGFVALAWEVIEAGFWPLIFLAGDGLAYSPVGLTYGYDWLMAHLETLLEAFAPVLPYSLLTPGYDGIIGYNEQTQQFDGWEDPARVSRYLTRLRELAPECYSAIEPSAGPLGGTLPDFISTGAYNALDCVLNEFNSPPHDSVTWQTADRVLGPAFVRPPDMPTDEDPDAPFPANSPKWRYGRPTPRGMIQGVGFEVCTYQAVRGMPLAEQQHQVAYVKACGYPTTG